MKPFALTAIVAGLALFASSPAAAHDPLLPRRIIVIHGLPYVFVAAPAGYFYHPAYGYWRPDYGWWSQARRCWIDPDDNPPGPRGGPGTNWENPPGWRGGPGASPDRFGRCR